MKFNAIRIFVALIYISFMVVVFFKHEVNADNVFAILLCLSGLLMIFNPNLILPRQFISLSELGAMGKTWRIFMAVMAIFWGVLIAGGAFIKMLTTDITAGQILMGNIFGFVAYCGFKMLLTK